MHSNSILRLLALLVLPCVLHAQGSNFIRKNYDKQEVYIPMRDGTRLFTAIYSPRDTSENYPILLVKTPYGLKYYGEDNYPESIGPSPYLAREKYIIVYQEARGTFLSEGFADQMDPHLVHKPDSTYIDNSSDTYDAVDWLLKHTKNNGRVGLWGISYRGFYALSGIVDAHPGIKCSSPQAPIADWYAGDDMHHNGAFSLLPAFLFSEIVGIDRDSLTTKWPELKEYPVLDAYHFFLNCGKVSELDDKYFNGKSRFWDSIVAHPNYDEYWQKRNILPHLQNIEPAVLVTAGLFDHENLFGSTQAYHTLAKNNTEEIRLALGPWIHGGWSRTEGDSLGLISFEAPTSDYYQRNIELPFFNYHLKGMGNISDLANAHVFFTGQNTWETFNFWPPEDTEQFELYLSENQSLSKEKPAVTGFIADSYISDPNHPVPYSHTFHSARLFYNKEYMIEDQRFASARPDVLTYQSEVLEDTLTLAGPILARIYASVSSSDFDLVVKIIDEYPPVSSAIDVDKPKTEMAGYQQLVRAEILRAKYRNSLENPEPLIADDIEKLELQLNDIAHSFLPGHRIIIQIQSSWFPLYDRNPQVFTNIYVAEPDMYTPATIQVYRSREYPSSILFGRMK